MIRLFLALVLFGWIPPAFAQIQYKPVDQNMTSVEYPFPVSYYDFTAQNQKLRMAYMDVKPAVPNGKVIVLLHGKNFSASYWQRTITDLSQKGFRVIAPDQIGFGKSTKPEHLQYSFQALSSWTNDLLGSIGVQEYQLIGHSMGGMLATRMALIYPDKVKRLALINPIGLEDWRKHVPYKTVDQWYQQELKQTPDKIRNYQTKAYYDGKWKPEYDQSIANQAGWTLHKDYPIIAWNSALLYDMIFTQPVVYEFADLKMPVLLLLGTRDRTALGADSVKDKSIRDSLGRHDLLGKKIAAMNANIKLDEIEGVGHMPQVEAYDRYIHDLSAFLLSED